MTKKEGRRAESGKENAIKKMSNLLLCGTPSPGICYSTVLGKITKLLSIQFC